MSGELHDSQGSDLDSQAVSPSKRMHSPEHQESAKRHQQDSNPASLFEVAKEMFRQAREQDLHTTLYSLIRAKASPKEKEAVYSPFFKELALKIIGRDDIPVPPATIYAFHFCWACDSERGIDEWAINCLIDYMTKEDKKRPHHAHTPAPKISDVVRKAWTTDYVGESLDLLHKAINTMHPYYSKKPFGNLLSIIQGSGTGKSRLVHELSRSVFAIPIILRPYDDSQGFPLGDVADGRSLLDFFSDFNLRSARYIQRRYLLFLLKVIAFANQWIDLQKVSGVGTELLASRWHEYLGDPRSKVRIEMYTVAVDMSLPLAGFENILDEDIQFDTIQSRVQKFVDSVAKKIKPRGNDLGPSLVFYFDEAHHLTNITVTPNGSPKRTAYQHLCKAFTYMTETLVFALFLSTYSPLTEFAWKKDNSWSSRPVSSEYEESDDNLNDPFVELPFDVWKNPILVTEGSHSSKEICSLKFMARFGRPLFWVYLEQPEPANEKLMMTYAMTKLELRLEDPTHEKLHDYPLIELIPLLAVRVDLTFESNRDEAVLLEALLVASNMRIVYSVPRHRQYLYGGYPSEPFLAEAAARAIFKKCLTKAIAAHENIEWTEGEKDKIIATYKVDIPSGVSAWVEGGLINKGEGGQLAARMLCTLAHDIAILKNISSACDILEDQVSFSEMIPVVDFLRALISEEFIGRVLKARPRNTSGITLEEAFKDGFVHFTQFVKADDILTITDEAAYLFFLRGAAIQGYGNLDETNLVIPVWIRSNDNPDRWSMTAIFIQVEDWVDEAFIFDAQKTFEFFSQTEIRENRTRPYITIAMELGGLACPQRKTQKSKAKVKSESPPEQKSTPKMEAKRKEKRAQTSKSVTPHKSSLTSESLSGVETGSHERRQQARSGDHAYPCYDIRITGCSKRVYNVVGEDSYSSLLAPKDMLAEHPRSGEHIDAVRRMKPYWVANSSYNQANMKNGSRLGALVFQDQDAEEVVSDGADDSDEVYEEVIVHEY